MSVTGYFGKIAPLLATSSLLLLASCQSIQDPEISPVGSVAAPPQAKPLAIWFDRPPVALFDNADPRNPDAIAKLPTWTMKTDIWEREGFPVGNGRIGAMVFGGTAHERIQINEDTVWAGPGTKYRRIKPDARQGIAEARQLLWKGDYAGAEKVLAEKVLDETVEPRSYQTLGDIMLDFDGIDETKLTDYRRELDLETAIATTSFSQNGVTYRREVFSSAPDNALVARFEASKPASLNFSLGLYRGNSTITADGRCLTMTGQAQFTGENPGTKFRTRLCVEQTNGTLSIDGGKLRVSGADNVTLIMAVQTDYNHADPSRPLDLYQADRNAPVLKNAAATPYAQLRARHIAEYQPWFDRLKIELDGKRGGDVPTDQLLKSYAGKQDDLALLELYLQFGRYLLISSSRPGDLPANLQGIWADGYALPWDSDYHLDINIQMNYWLAEIGNLAELQQPYFDYFDRLSRAGEASARKLGMKGSMNGVTSDAYLLSDLYGLPHWGMWVTGGPWAVSHFYQHYLYSGDKTFLRDRALPVQRRYVAFLLDWLVADPKTGLLVSGPATSPENKFYATDPKTGEKVKASVTMGPSFDQQITRELFTDYLSTLDALGIANDPLAAPVKAALAKLAPPTIGPDGRIREWPSDLVEVEPGHRHISHLYGAFPGDQFTWRRDPQMLAAARKSAEYRLANGGGGTGWSRAWMVNLYARFKDPQGFAHHLAELMHKSTNKNLFDTHPPFQIDGNFGASAGMLEAMVQSHDGGIEILPAWPKQWMMARGAVSGIRARGGFEVALGWMGGKLDRLTIKSLTGGECRIILNAHVPAPVIRDAKTGASVKTWVKDGTATFATRAGESYEIAP